MSNDEENVSSEQPHHKLNRRAFLGETARTLSMALASAGVFYEFIDTIARKPEQVAFADGGPSPQGQDTDPLPEEQYIVPSTQILNVNSIGVSSSGSDTIPVVAHPLHNHIITAKVKVPANAKALMNIYNQDR
jgi:hypothetical protein